MKSDSEEVKNLVERLKVYLSQIDLKGKSLWHKERRSTQNISGLNSFIQLIEKLKFCRFEFDEDPYNYNDLDAWKMILHAASDL